MSRVLYIPDLHCPGMREGFPDFLVGISEAWSCDRFVCTGDLIDWNSINFHGRTPGTPSVEREIDLARSQVAEIYKRFPECEWLIGNHDALPTRHAEASGLPLDIIRSEVDYWGLSGWQVYPRYYDLLVDGCIVRHGDKGRSNKFNAAKVQADDEHNSVICGHFHAQAGVSWGANQTKRYFGLQVGCGIDSERLMFSYGRRFANKPVIGCGVVIDGEFPVFEPMHI